jgi:hypothetical protein
VIGPLAALARRAGIPVAAIGGRVDGNARELASSLGLVSISASGRSPDPASALRRAAAALTRGQIR